MRSQFHRGHLVRSLGFTLFALSCASIAYAQRTFTIDVPGATFTRIFGLNAQGDVCGGTQVSGRVLAFVASRHAEFADVQTFAFPGSAFTQCRGINALGQIVGVYQTADAKSHAFVADGPDFISIDVPGATDSRGFGIDPYGQIVGRYTTPDGIVHGFFRSRDGNVVTIDGPAATATEASGITPQGDITGIYQTADGRFHGYILSKNGFQTVDVPGAHHTGTATGGLWMSAAGELAGYYQPQGAPAGQNRGWVRLADGTFHTYTYPGSVDTCFFNVNERGDVVGRYVAGGAQHGLYIERLGRRPPTQ